jgi:putative glycosyltransferase (TIGR04348 family)
MRVHLITPSPSRARGGNWTTAARWAAMLRRLGHRVGVTRDYQGQPADLMIALHAWRSADSIVRFANQHPDRPLVVVLTGTDAYRFIHSHPAQTLRSIELARVLVGLHDLIDEVVPSQHRAKLRVIHQSAPPGLPRQPAARDFRVCVAGHLREEKDPFRPAYAVRDLPPSSRIRVDLFGGAHSPEWAEQARAEIAGNPRFHWHGEVPRHRLRRALARSHLLVLPSRMEGGANVVGEAVMADLPVVASRIHGSIGLLGEDYPGLYPVEDTAALQDVLLRAERDADFYGALEYACRALRPLFDPAREERELEKLLRDAFR